MSGLGEGSVEFCVVRPLSCVCRLHCLLVLSLPSLAVFNSELVHGLTSGIKIRAYVRGRWQCAGQYEIEEELAARRVRL